MMRGLRLRSNKPAAGPESGAQGASAVRRAQGAKQEQAAVTKSSAPVIDLDLGPMRTILAALSVEDRLRLGQTGVYFRKLVGQEYPACRLYGPSLPHRWPANLHKSEWQALYKEKADVDRHCAPKLSPLCTDAARRRQQLQASGPHDLALASGFISHGEHAVAMVLLNRAEGRLLHTPAGRAALLTCLRAQGRELEARFILTFAEDKQAAAAAELAIAWQGGATTLADLLSRQAVDMESPDSHDVLPLVAVARACPALLHAMLAAGAGRLLAQPGYSTLACELAAHNSATSLRLLVDHGLPIDQPDVSGKKPIAHAIEAGALEAIQVLLEAKATVDRVDAAGRPALHLALLQSDYQPAIDLLLAHGVQADVQDEAGRTPLHVAAATCDSRLARSLLDHGADINVADLQGYTPLHRLVTSRVFIQYFITKTTGPHNILDVLLAAGANLAARHSDCLTPFQHLAWYHREITTSRSNVSIKAAALEKLCHDPIRPFWGMHTVRPKHYCDEYSHVLDLFLPQPDAGKWSDWEMKLAKDLGLWMLTQQPK